MASATVMFLSWDPLRPLRPLHPSCTRSVGILGLGPLCFLFFVFPSRPLPLTPPGRVLNGRSKTLGPVVRSEEGRAFRRRSAPDFLAPRRARKGTRPSAQAPSPHDASQSTGHIGRRQHDVSALNAAPLLGANGLLLLAQ